EVYRMEGYEVKLDAFHGPLDLLLHLIKELEIDIYDIPMSVLTEQYMNYIQKMNALEINVASEYLVMASELLRIKSKMLLPEPPLEEFDEDPREELVTQLLDYQNYKMYSEELRQLKEEAEKYLVKAPHEFDEVYVNEELSITLSELMDAYNKVRQRVEVQSSTSFIESESYTHEDAVSFLQDQFKHSYKLSLTDLFSKEVNNYNKPHFMILKYDDIYYLKTTPLVEEYVVKLLEERPKNKLSNQALEVLSIIAYNQPVARGVIEDLRGVSPDGPINTLLN